MRKLNLPKNQNVLYARRGYPKSNDFICSCLFGSLVQIFLGGGGFVICLGGGGGGGLVFVFIFFYFFGSFFGGGGDFNFFLVGGLQENVYLKAITEAVEGLLAAVAMDTGQ